jgi:uncharacterized protein YdbL (DUF1318 family)
MKTILFLLTFFTVALTTLTTFAAEASEGPGVVAEKFFAGYLAQVEADKDTKAWVAKSKMASKEFKAAYKKAMSAEEIEADAVTQAQDTPTSPFKAGEAVIKDSKATVTLTAKFGDDAHKVNVQLVQQEGAWLIQKITLAE